jgi:membrane-associated phospholipid phosphatase
VQTPSTPAELRLYTETRRAASSSLLVPLLAGALLAAALVPPATLIDITVARWFQIDRLPGDLNKTIHLSEVYAHGIGVIAIMVAVLTLAPHKRWYVPRLATMAFGAGALTTIVKMFVIRLRPGHVNLDVASYDVAWRWAFDWQLHRIASMDSSLRSFPSGHTSTAVAMTVGLMLLFPRGRWLFLGACLMSMLQRLHSHAHFPSDVLGGIAIALAWSFVCLHPRLLGKLLEKMEPEGGRFETTRRARPFRRRQAA